MAACLIRIVFATFLMAVVPHYLNASLKTSIIANIATFALVVLIILQATRRLK